MVIRKGSSQYVRPKSSRVIDERLFIGTLGVNCLEYTRRCIDTVKTSCKEVKFAYIDNGSTQENIDKLKTWNASKSDIHEFVMGFNGYNAGVAVGWNQLIKMAIEWNADKILIVNNDIVFGSKTIDGLVDEYNRLREEIPDTMIVTATNHTKNPSELESIKQVKKIQEHPDFSCYMMDVEAVNLIGYFCEDYDPAFFEDNDMHWRILLMGYKAFSTDWAPYSHIASRTRHGNPNLVTHENFRLNKIRFMRNMATRSVDQEIANERYRYWLDRNPSLPHPNHTEVLKLCREHSLGVRSSSNPWAIDDDLVDFLQNLTIANCPI